MNYKKKLEDLAIFGGTPAVTEKLHVGRPNIGDRCRLLSRINEALDRAWLTNDGPFVQEFESRISDMLGVKHCITMCNATVALELVTRALSMVGEVIVPSFTFVATAHILAWQHIEPKFCDVNLETHQIDPDAVIRAITPRTTGILAVHLWGKPCDVDTLASIASERGLKLVFDAAHAFGCSYKNRMIGGFGDAEVFSFHATKFVNSFEGGAVVTNNDELATQLRLLRNFGFTGHDNVALVGTNGKMNEVSAAMGLTNLESFDSFVAINLRNHREYRRLLSGIQGIRLLAYDAHEKSNYQYVVIEVDKCQTFIDRDRLQAVLQAENVLARRYFYPGCHQMQPYRGASEFSHERLPNTDTLSKSVLVLPTGTAIGLDDIAAICDVIEFAISHGREISGSSPP